MHESVFSPAQVVGYFAFAAGVFAFLQKQDRRFKIALTFQAIVYGIHFVLLGNLPAAAGNSVSVVRNLVSLRTRSNYVAAGLVALTCVFAYFTVKSPVGLIPLVATVISIVGMFKLDGIPMRLCMLVCTGMWLTNNLLCHSIGGVMLESTIGATNCFTMVRIGLANKRARVAALSAEKSASIMPARDASS